MSYEIKQSSAGTPLLFILTLASDHISPATGLTPTVTIGKNGGTFATPAGTVTEIGNGWYKVAGNATDTNTLGPIALHVTVATADPCDFVVATVVGFDPQSANLGLFAQLLTTAAPGTEVYATAQTVPTLAQVLLFIQQFLSNQTIVAGVGTIKKLDNSTQAAVMTYNDPANPSGTFRAS